MTEEGAAMITPRDIILRPIVSEKSYASYDANVYTFEVASEREQDPDQARGRGRSSA